MAEKYLKIAESITQRLRNGDYLLNDLPGERKLAIEFGVSHMTGRRAIQHLVEKGVLPPRPVGRAVVRRSTGEHALNIAFVQPAFSSPIYNEWRIALEQVVGDLRGNVRTVPYVSWHDPVLAGVLDSSFDGIFLIPLPNQPSLLLQQRLQKSRDRLVTLFEDMTHLGIPCVDGINPGSIDGLIEHLHGLGHRRVDCLNTEPNSQIIQRRIDVWAEGIKRRGMQGQLRNHAVEPFAAPDQRAYEVASELLKSDQFSASAIFCTTLGMSVGLLRAMYEQRIKVGKDISVCIPDGTNRARLMTPSLTTLETSDLNALLGRATQWIIRGGREWDGSLKIEVTNAKVVCGESTGKARKYRGRPDQKQKQQATGTLQAAG
jgi:DNA-binding LacI/PurR family transcriptional regulator